MTKYNPPYGSKAREAVNEARRLQREAEKRAIAAEIRAERAEQSLHALLTGQRPVVIAPANPGDVIAPGGPVPTEPVIVAYYIVCAPEGMTGTPTYTVTATTPDGEVKP